ncbi:MAG: hypothetical protein E7641_02185 [Ruminococcaceae bacterium]|nr:hypothetical protein [Oscillospiraceae bacterium]
MNKRYIPKKKNKLNSRRPLSRIAEKVFYFGLSVILFYLLSFLIVIINSHDIPSYVLSHIHFDSLEHIVMSATLIIIGTAVIDLCEKEGAERH